MPLQGSGPISFEQIRAEFSGTNPVGLASYYRGGGRVPNIPANNNIPTSGPIGVTSFYGAVKEFVYTLPGDVSNLDLRGQAVAGGWNQIDRLLFVIPSGVVVSASSTGLWALTINGSFPNGGRLVNNGFILGMGGAGGQGGGCAGSGESFAPGTPGSGGGGGGPGLICYVGFEVDNTNGVIAGGGGGGGGGAGTGRPINQFSAGRYAGGGGGGGRTGRTNTSGGPAGTQGSPAFAGGTGTFSGGAGGGAGGGFGANVGGTGGTGGSWGAAGGTGGSGAGSTVVTGPYGGGPAGTAIAGNGNISWVNVGTRIGAIT